MPLLHSPSKQAFTENVKTLMNERSSPHVKDASQALAIAYATKRRAGRAMGGPAPAPWYVRNEAHSLNHTGPIMSAVPGRTDRHNVSVPGGSYIFPADFISHLGQNNSQAGMKILSNMGFGSGGPYGGAAPHVARGMGLPKPPSPMAISDRGGARGDSKLGGSVPIIVAGGEFAAPPDAIMRVLKTDDIDHAHRVLDHWVMKTRKEHIKVLKGLPPPAKS